MSPSSCSTSSSFWVSVAATLRRKVRRGLSSKSSSRSNSGRCRLLRTTTYNYSRMSSGVCPWIQQVKKDSKSKNNPRSSCLSKFVLAGKNLTDEEFFGFIIFWKHQNVPLRGTTSQSTMELSRTNYTWTHDVRQEMRKKTNNSWFMIQSTRSRSNPCYRHFCNYPPTCPLHSTDFYLDGLSRTFSKWFTFVQAFISRKTLWPP